MTYSDSNPERRNLTILSLAIIVFYLGEGYLLNKEISFTLINVGFHKQAVLVVFVWVLLFWFLFRYTVTNRHKHGEELDASGIRVNMNYSPVRVYLQKSGQPFTNAELNSARAYCNTPGNWVMGYKHDNGYRVVALNGLDGYLIVKLYLLKISSPQ